MRTWVGAGVVLAASVGCAYQGPSTKAASPSEVATVEVPSGAVWVSRVDGDRVSGGPVTRRLVLAPGWHVVKVELHAGSGLMSLGANLGFKAEAGTSYILRNEVRRIDAVKGTWRTWIQRADTNAVVSQVIQ